MQEFKICGRPKQISKQKISLEDDEIQAATSSKYNEETSNGLENGNFQKYQNFESDPRPRPILKRPKSLPIRKQYSSFVDSSPKPNHASPNRRMTQKTKLQNAIDTLPDFKTHWETLIEHINNVS